MKGKYTQEIDEFKKLSVEEQMRIVDSMIGEFENKWQEYQ